MNTLKTDWVYNDFTKNHLLGEGAWGKVYSVIENATGKVYALKEIANINSNLDEITNHIIIRGHPNVCDIFGTFVYENSIIIVQEMCGFDLFDYVFNTPNNNITEKQKVKWMIQLLRAVNHCHNLGILHLDIKIENCVIDKDNNLKLIDFGFSQNETSIKHISSGTPYYLAPEIAISRIENKTPYVSKATDVWACGAFFVYLFQSEIYYKEPNIGFDTVKVLYEIVNHHIVKKDLFDVPKPYTKIVLRMLEYDYNKRITISKALAKFEKII